MGASTLAQLVFVPAWGVGHLVSAVEVAKTLVDRDDRLSITVLVLNPQRSSKAKPFADLLESVSSSYSASRIHFIELPREHTADPSELSIGAQYDLAALYKQQARSAVAGLTESPGAPPLVGFVIDMFCTPMIDVADEFGVPTYSFFTCGAAFLGFVLHVQATVDELEGKDLLDNVSSDAELAIPTLVNPVPVKVFPTVVLDGGHRGPFLRHIKRVRETKGILVNTFEELEPHAVRALLADSSSSNSSNNIIPPVYPVGPILNLKGPGSDKSSEILRWLDHQPRWSVVFLCFGSNGSFHEDQLKEMARGIEASGHRFLWSIRRAPPKEAVMLSFPEEYEDPAEVLPEGFVERTSGRGKVIGWAPQVEVLAHPSVGGFVTHCGWNSTQESLWFGVPTTAWPLYAEQQFNAFEMKVELGMAVEVKMDYRKDSGEVVAAGAVEGAIRRLMEVDDGGRKEKVREMSERSRKAVAAGGSAHSAVGRFISDVFKNIPSTA